RMAKVQQTIRTRDQLKEQIIDRRVEDLIGPGLKWDESSQGQAVRVGDSAKRPNLAESAKAEKSESGPGQSTLDELRDFQNRLRQAQRAVERTGEDLKLARQAFLNKTGPQQAMDAAEKKFRESEQE